MHLMCLPSALPCWVPGTEAINPPIHALPPNCHAGCQAPRQSIPQFMLSLPIAMLGARHRGNQSPNSYSPSQLPCWVPGTEAINPPVHAFSLGINKPCRVQPAKSVTSRLRHACGVPAEMPPKAAAALINPSNRLGSPNVRHACPLLHAALDGCLLQSHAAAADPLAGRGQQRSQPHLKGIRGARRSRRPCRSPHQRQVWPHLRGPALGAGGAARAAPRRLDACILWWVAVQRLVLGARAAWCAVRSLCSRLVGRSVRVLHMGSVQRLDTKGLHSLAWCVGPSPRVLCAS